MKRFVLDASVALAWFIDRPIAPYAKQVTQLLLAGSRGVVPSIWRLEVANGFVVAERRGILSPPDISLSLQNLEIVIAQSIDESTRSVPMRHIITSARQFQLTAYDAEYLDIARLQQLPLATLDKKLEEAATKAGVPLVQ